ncbi:uncharacterized protein LOC144699923 [Wolffia australiana]
MGCLLSTTSQRKKESAETLGELAIFLPGLRIPKTSDPSLPIGQRSTETHLERLSTLRARIAAIAAQEAHAFLKADRTPPSSHQDGPPPADLNELLEEYLAVLLVPVKDGSQSIEGVQFSWVNQSSRTEDPCISCAWYEVLSVLHLMASLCFSEVNRLFLSSAPEDEDKRGSIDILLKAAGYVDCAVREVLPRIPLHLRKDLPPDLSEGLLRAICHQALALAVDVQLGIAIDSPKATLAVKRRLACEMAKHWQQAQESIAQIPCTQGWRFKYQSYIKCKCAEANAAAYYFHGQFLDESITERSVDSGAIALLTAEEYLKECIQGGEAFNSAPPRSSPPATWGNMKFLSKVIPRDAQNKRRRNPALNNQKSVVQSAQPLPDFILALKPDGYDLPLQEESSLDENNQRRDEGDGARPHSEV